ncbi:MAG: CBS domain-containing protein [Planctomycetota bacterium]|jgi:predicted transcriptional regulator
MLQAKTIMIKDVATVRPQDTLDQVIEILVDKNITGIPVVNEDNTLAGIITERDILSYMLEQDAITHLTDSNLCEHTVYHAMTEPQGPDRRDCIDRTGCFFSNCHIAVCQSGIYKMRGFHNSISKKDIHDRSGL